VDFPKKGVFQATSKARFTSKGRFCGQNQCPVTVFYGENATNYTYWNNDPILPQQTILIGACADDTEKAGLRKEIKVDGHFGFTTRKIPTITLPA